MVRREAEKYLKEKLKQGYITHSMILEIYGMDEEIPTEVMNLICHKPTKQSPIRIITGSKGIEMMKEAFEGLFKKSNYK